MLIRAEPNRTLGVLEFWPVDPHPLFVFPGEEEGELESLYLPQIEFPLGLLYNDMPSSSKVAKATPEDVVEDFFDLQKRRIPIPRKLKLPLANWLVRLFLLSPDGILLALRKRTLYDNLPLHLFRELGIDFYFVVHPREGVMQRIVLTGNAQHNIHISLSPGLQLNAFYLPDDPLLLPFAEKLRQFQIFEIEVIEKNPC